MDSLSGCFMYVSWGEQKGSKQKGLTFRVLDVRKQRVTQSESFDLSGRTSRRGESLLVFLGHLPKFVSLLDALGTNSSSEIKVNVAVRRPPVIRTDMYCRPQSEKQFLHIAVSDADTYLIMYVRSVRLSYVLQCMHTKMPANNKNSKKHANTACGNGAESLMLNLRYVYLPLSCKGYRSKLK